MARVRGLYDLPMWASFARRALLLQCCKECKTYRYPPAAVCPQCLAAAHDWIEASGSAEIVSWAIFHRQYLAAYPAPYNVIAVRLAEGPIMVSNLVGETPRGSWIGHKVRLTWGDHAEEGTIPRFMLSDT